MSQIMKSFLAVFLIMFMVVSAVGILSAFLTVTDAQDLHARIINELEDSDYSGNVLRENFTMAQSRGYGLTVTLLYEDGSRRSCTQEADVTSEPLEVVQAQVDLVFPFRIAFFGINDLHTLSGYAR